MVRILLLPGDGIGPEVTVEARRVLDTGARTADLASGDEPSLGCRAMAGLVLEQLGAA